MKHRTNRQRAERKLRKATELQAKTDAQPKQIHTSWHSNPGYEDIMRSIRQKTSVITILNAHARRGIKKIMLFPRLLWTNGTYNRKEHGKFKSTEAK